MKEALKKYGAAISGGAAGLVNGLFGAGGGMVLLPLLEHTTDLSQHEIFASSVCVILPMCMAVSYTHLTLPTKA